jgi:transposase
VYLFGTLSLDGRQLFRQYNRFNEDTFLSYLKKVKRKFHKFIIFLDRAVQHCRSRKIKRYLSDNSNNIKFEYFPKGSPEFNAVEECWKQGKDDLLVSEYYPKFRSLKERITQYYRTKHFKLDIVKYLLRGSADLC